jgi:hypothetical protein
VVFSLISLNSLAFLRVPCVLGCVAVVRMNILNQFSDLVSAVELFFWVTRGEAVCVVVLV